MDKFDETLSLFGAATEAHARRGDPDTSHEAAKAATSTIRATQVTVLRALHVLNRSFGRGVADKELCAYLGEAMSPSGARSRRSELVDAGYVEWTGDKRTIGNRSHRTWNLTAKGHAALVLADARHNR